MLMATREVPVDPRLNEYVASVQSPDDDPYDEDDMGEEITARSYDCFTRLSDGDGGPHGYRYLRELSRCDQGMITEAIDLAISQWSEK